MIYASTYIPKTLAANKYKAQSTWKSNIWYMLSAHLVLSGSLKALLGSKCAVQMLVRKDPSPSRNWWYPI